MGSFFDKLEAHQSLLCVGLDPNLAQMPEGLPANATGVAQFLRRIIEATADLICAYKPNLAFYEALGIPGLEALRSTLDAIPKDVPVIGDAKRGDVGHTARAYASALFDYWGFDAVTVNPYLGGDAVAPFLERADRGVLVLCRTSNPGAGDLQDLPVVAGGETRPLYEVVAGLARSWNGRGNVGLVVGSTYPDEMGRLRGLCPEMTFLVPGVGAQGGDLEATLRQGLDARGRGLIISASRQVLYASRGPDFAEAARREALALRDEMERLRAAVAGTGRP